MKIKRILSVILVFCLAASILPVFAKGEITVLVNGEKVNFDQAPVIENGRTLVPVRAIFEKLGAQVSYEPVRKKVYAELGSRYVAFLIGADTIYTNDGGTKIDTPAKIINDRTLVPVRAVSEGFGAKVGWDQATRTVTVNTDMGANPVIYKYQNYNSYSQDSKVILKGLCAYPEIVSESPSAATLNVKFRDGAYEYIKYLCNQPNEAAAVMYENYCAQGSKGDFYPAEYKRTFDVTYNRGSIISFAFHTLSGTKGDFSNGKIKNGVTYDLATGQLMKKENIFSISQEELTNLIISTFNIHISANPRLYKTVASEYVKDNAVNAEFYIDSYGVVFYLPVNTILVDKTEFPSVRIDYEGNEDLFVIKDFSTSKDVVEEEPKEEVKEETKEEIKEEIEEKPEEETKEEIEDEIKEEVKEEPKEEIKEPEYNEPVNEKEYEVSFADNLYSKMPSDKNYMISPLSIKMALGLLASGARGETLEEIKDVMQIATTSEFNQKTKELIDIYTNTKELKLNVANSVWVNTDSAEGIEFKAEYKDAVKEFYNGEAGKVNNSNAEETINGWVNDNTNGKIPSIIDDSDFAAALVNAVYFNGRWENEFRKQATQQGEFADRNGKFHTVDFMRQLGRFNYFINDKATVIELPYTRHFDHNGNTNISGDKALSMYVIMPRFDTKIESIDKYLSGVSMENAYVDISLPKFKTEFSLNLNEILNSLGMNKSFTSGADFSAMSDIPMAVSDVIHKTYIDVNEEGTEAAAATAVLMKVTSALITNDPVVIKIDKPFVYVIKDTINNEILFMGEYAFVE